MANKHGEQRHIRLAHFLINGCTTLARALVGKDVKVSKPREHEPVDKPWSLDSFLHKNMKILCKKCNPKQQDILFPGHQDKSDIEQWDISLLCLVITNCTNNETVRGDIKQLQNIRNIIFHAGNTDISQEVYDRNVEILDCIVERCCKFIDEPNFSSTMQELQKNFKKGNVIVTDKDFEAIRQWYESDPFVMLNSKVDKLSDDQQLLMNKVDEILELTKQSGLKGIVLPDTNVELIVKNCDSAKEKVISEYLVKLLKCRMADDIPDVPEADKQKVFDLVREAMAELLTGGRELVDIYQACVNLTIRCATFASLRDLWIDCMTGKLTRAFKPLEIYVRQLTGCPDITIEVEITQFEFYRCIEATVMQIPKAVQAGNDDVFGEQADLFTEIASACIDDIDTNSSRHSPDEGAVTRTEGDGTRVIIRMQPTSFNQAKHLWRACQSDRFNDKLERLSQAIQEAYGFSDLSITAKVESTSPYEDDSNLLIQGQGVSSSRSSNASSSSSYAEVENPLEHITHQHHETLAKLQNVNTTIQNLEKQLDQKRKEIESLKKKDRQKQRELHKIQYALEEKDNKIDELLHEINIAEKEKEGLSQNVDELTDKMNLMEQRFATNEGNQNRRINELEDAMGSLQANLRSEMNAQMEELKASMEHNMSPRPNAQIQDANSITRVPNQARRTVHQVNASRNVQTTRNETGRLPLPKINR